MSTTQVKVAAKSINLYNHVLHLLGMVVWTESGASGKMLPGMRMNGKENSGDLFDRFPYSYRKTVTHMKRLEGGSRAEEKKKGIRILCLVCLRSPFAAILQPNAANSLAALTAANSQCNNNSTMWGRSQNWSIWVIFFLFNCRTLIFDNGTF